MAELLQLLGSRLLLTSVDLENAALPSALEQLQQLRHGQAAKIPTKDRGGWYRYDSSHIPCAGALQCEPRDSLR